MEFDHVGLCTFEKKGEEDWVEATKVWVTNPKKHPFNVEWLRYADDSTVEKSFKERPHIAYRVDNLEEASKGMKVLLAPFEVGGFLKVGFFEYKDGTVIEFMQYLGDKDKWFNK
jgi:hypothetical protein